MFADLFKIFLFVFHVLNLPRQAAVWVVRIVIKCNFIILLCVNSSLDIFQQGTIVRSEVLVLVDVLSILMPYLPKAVHIQLSNKRWEVIMFKEPGQYSLCKLPDILYVEWVISRCPWNYFIYFHVLV